MPDDDEPGSADTGSEDTGAGPDERHSGNQPSDAGRSVSDADDSETEDQWVERLKAYKRELDSTSGPERRRELIEIIREVEDGLVEKGVFDESERGEYSVEQTPFGSADGSDTPSTGDTGTPARNSGTHDSDGDATSGDHDTSARTESETASSERASRTGDRSPESDESGQEPERTSESQGDERTSGSQRASDADSESDTTEASSGASDRQSDGESTANRGSDGSGTSASESLEQGTDEPREDPTGTADRSDRVSGSTADSATDQDNTESAIRDAESEDTAEQEPDGQPVDPEDSDRVNSSEPSDELASTEQQPETGAVEDSDTQSDEADRDMTPEPDEEQVPDVDELADRVAELETLFEEFKRSNEHEHQEIRKYTVEAFAGNMLRVRDTLERAVELFEWEDGKQERMEAIISQFDQQFTAGDISPIDPESGVELDYDRHEVVGREETDSRRTDEIIRVDRKGFVLDDRVIRPAQVVIAV